jgi:DNA-binding NtrC family response regulator
MRLLIIGKPDELISLASQMAKMRGASVTQTSSVEAALTLLRSGKGAELIMVDVEQDIRLLAESLKAERIYIPIVGFGIQANSEKAASAIRAGAKEYIPLPPDKDLIAAVIEAITEENNTLLYKAPAMQQVVSVAKQVAPSDANVLITGESGTGKEMLARFIHLGSKRSSHPFISVNCAAIPENLLESEMFGHERGAFTGAISRRIGKFEEATGGTLLLDEISEMDIRLQAKLLRAIQEKEIDRVGGAQPVKVNARILATSNRDLKEEVAAGRFREDLFFRLNIIHLHIPPLRERPEDIPLFAEHFAKKYAEANGVAARALMPEALAILKSHGWPGNVRELENTMHRAVLLASGDTIGPEALFLQPAPGSGKEINAANIQTLVGRTMESVEKELILSTLTHCLGNRTQAANILGISIRTLRNKLKQYEEEAARKAGGAS